MEAAAWAEEEAEKAAAAAEAAEEDKRALEQDTKEKQDLYERTKEWVDKGADRIAAKKASMAGLEGDAKAAADDELAAMETTFNDAKDNVADQKKAFDDAKALADGWAAKEKKRIEDKRKAERDAKKAFMDDLKQLEKEEKQLFNALQAAEKKAVGQRKR